MRRLAGPLVGALVLASLALPATAARTVCRILTDARGDASLGEVVPLVPTVVPGTPADDLLSADIASDGRTVTAVLRLADVVLSDPQAPTGRAYSFFFTVRNADSWFFLQAKTYVTGTRFLYGDIQDELERHSYLRVLGEARGVVDIAHDQVRVHVAAAALGGRGGLRRGMVLHDLQASVGRVVGQGAVDSQVVADVEIPLSGTTSTVDQAVVEGARYVVGTPSCVRPGA